MPLRIADVVEVTARIAPVGVVRRALGRALFLTTDSRLPGSGAGRVRAFSRLADVADVFPAASEPYKAAARYFAAANPENLLIGSWRKAGSAVLGWRVRGGATASLDTIKRAGATGSLSVGGDDFTAINVAAAGDFAAVAAALQAKLRANAGGAAWRANATVAFEAAGNRFVVTFSGALPEDAGGAPITFGEHSAGTGNDLSDSMGLTAADGAAYLPGGAAESVSDALTDIARYDDQFYFVVAEAAVAGTADMEAIATWATANEAMYLGDSGEAGATAANENASRLAALHAVGSPRAAAVWSAEQDYKAVALAGLLSSIDFTTPAGFITPFGKPLTGCAADDLTGAARAELERKRVNYYARFGGTPIFAPGTTFDGDTWIDSRYWLDWFVNEVRGEVFDLIRSSGRLALTPSGMSAVRSAIDRACERGVSNGGIAPGQVSTAMRQSIRQVTGDNEFDGTLSTGYLVFASPLSEQSAGDRAARTAPAFRVWLHGSGAIQSAEIDLTLEG